MAGKVVAEERASIVQSDSLTPPQRQPRPLKIEVNRPAQAVNSDDGGDEDEDSSDMRPMLAPNLYIDSPRAVHVDGDVDSNEINRRHCVGMATLAGLFLSVLLCVFFLHYLSHHESFSALPPTQQRFMSSTSTGGARESLEQYTSGVRHTGTAGDLEMAKYIRNKAIHFGIEEKLVKLEEFEILVNAPETLKLTIHTSPSAEIDLMANYYKNTTKTLRQPFPPFHLYAKNGTVTAPLVYAHYGRSADYEALATTRVSVVGCIVLVRMGVISLPAKITLAAKYGAAAVLTYHDPFDDGTARGKTFPDGPWRSSGQASSGSVYMGDGDPATPDGSSSMVDRISVEEVFSSDNTYNILPSIPSMPVSARMAARLLQQTLTNASDPIASSVFTDWEGGALDTTTDLYRVARSAVEVTIDNRNKYEFKKVWNVLITIPGSREADRYVIVGAPRDSLNAGAVSPGSGNAVFLELLRAIGDLLTNGWVPHRTILLASFDGEQYGTVGSSEWIDRHFSHLGGRGIIHLHLRDVVRGAGPLVCRAAASLRKNIYLTSTEIVQPKAEVDVTKLFASPSVRRNRRLDAMAADARTAAIDLLQEDDTEDSADEWDDSLLPLNSTFGREDIKDSGDSVYSYWLRHTRQLSPAAKLPRVGLPGSSLDGGLSPFQMRLGIPTVELSFDGGYFGVSGSRNDSFSWMTTFADPSFTFHRAIAQLYGSILLAFSDAVFLQYDFTEVARDLRYGEAYLQNGFKRFNLTQLSLKRLSSSIVAFETAAVAVAKELREMRDEMVNLISGELVVDLKKVREMNTRLLMTEKAFLLPTGLPHMPWLKHCLYGISEFDDYRVGYYPGVAHEIQHGNAVAIKRELTRLSLTIEQAADTLSTPLL